MRILCSTVLGFDFQNVLVGGWYWRCNQGRLGLSREIDTHGERGTGVMISIWNTKLTIAISTSWSPSSITNYG